MSRTIHENDRPWRRCAILATAAILVTVSCALAHKRTGQRYGPQRIAPATGTDYTELWGGETSLECPSDFTDPAAWFVYDPGRSGVGVDPDGYHDAVFDGRYVYFIPYRAEYPNFSGEVLRYDTTGAFQSSSSWAAFDPGAQGVGAIGDGYAGGVFDGRYVYFVPWAYGTGTYHGEVMRYDTWGVFDDTASWDAFNPGANGVGTRPRGYRGAVFDGKYVYFVPTFNGVKFHGEFLRLDTEGDFLDVASWTTFDTGVAGVSGYNDGFSGGAFDGRYAYFAPYHNGDNYHGRLLRLDTLDDFTNAAAWTAYDPGEAGVGNDPDGYIGGVFDGTYVYFVPFNNGTTYSGEVLRYDPALAFTDPQAWSTFDAPGEGLGVDPTGFCWAVYDGRYVTFVPMYNDSGSHNEMLRFDTWGDFADVSAWTAFVPDSPGLGYRGGAFDGKYIYFAPAGIYNPHGNVLRFDTALDSDNDGVPDTCDVCPGFDDNVDENGNGVPDGCDCPAPDAPTAVLDNVSRNRYVAFAGANPGVVMAIRVTPVAGGPSLWVGPPHVCPEEDASDPMRTFVAAGLQCEPYFQDWSSLGVVEVYGAELIPDASYDLQAIKDCASSFEVETNYSIPLTMTTSLFGDVVEPYYTGPGDAQPDFRDISAVVAKFVGDLSAPIKAAAQLQPNVVDPMDPVNFKDIAAAVSAFLGAPFDELLGITGPCDCPSSVTCGATACQTHADCGAGLCIEQWCRDACGRCAP